MQFLGLTGALYSGKLGGLVGSRGRGGAQLRAHIVPRQVVTQRSSAARAATGQLPALWRLLTDAERASWAQLANTLPVRDKLGQQSTLSGYALYIACARRLLTVGLTAPVGSAPAAPSIPAISGLQAQPVFRGSTPQTGLLDVELSTFEPLPTALSPLLRASAAVSPGRGNIRASDLRIIEAGTLWPVNPHSVLAQWAAVWGTCPPAGAITFELALVDPISGLAGAPVRASAIFGYGQTIIETETSYTLEDNGVPIATVTEQTLEIDNVPEAGN